MSGVAVLAWVMPALGVRATTKKRERQRWEKKCQRLGARAGRKT